MNPELGVKLHFVTENRSVCKITRWDMMLMGSGAFRKETIIKKPPLKEDKSQTESLVSTWVKRQEK